MTFPKGKEEESGIIPELAPPKDPLNLRRRLRGLYQVFKYGAPLSKDELAPDYRNLKGIALKAKKGVEILKRLPLGHFSGDLDAIMVEDLVNQALLGGRGGEQEMLREIETIENYASVMLGEQGKDGWPYADQTRDISILVRFACEHPNWYEDR